MADISQSNWDQTDASNTTAAPDGAPEGMAPSGVNNVIRAMMGAIKRRYARSIPATTGGTNTAYTLSYAVAPASYADGETFLVQFNQTCGASPTLNINSLGAKALHKFSSSAWGAVASGDIAADDILLLTYNSSAGTLRIVAKASVWDSGFIANSLADAKGDIIVATADNTWARKAVGSNGTIPMARSADTSGLAYVAALNKYIYGLTYANNGSDVTNDIDIAAGGCMDATGAYWITLSALTKRLDAAWAVGTNQGGLDTGSIANADYYIWAIARSDTGVTDVLFSTSATAPTMPTSYDFKRLIGWFKRAAGAIVTFKTYELTGGGLHYAWDAPRGDVALDNTLTTARRTDALSVPLDFSVLADVVAGAYDGTESNVARICCPDETDAAPTGILGTNTANMSWLFGELAGYFTGFVRTSATGTVACRSLTATTDRYTVVTNGFHWSRR